MVRARLNGPQLNNKRLSGQARKYTKEEKRRIDHETHENTRKKKKKNKKRNHEIHEKRRISRKNEKVPCLKRRGIFFIFSEVNCKCLLWQERFDSSLAPDSKNFLNLSNLSPYLKI